MDRNQIYNFDTDPVHKKWTSYEDQITILEQRGMFIDNRTEALNALKT